MLVCICISNKQFMATYDGSDEAYEDKVDRESDPVELTNE
jgi:hypothetical protein